MHSEDHTTANRWGEPRFVRPTAKQVALFCHLAKLQWKLACRIPWSGLCPKDYRRIEEVQGLVEDIAKKTRLARTRKACLAEAREDGP